MISQVFFAFQNHRFVGGFSNFNYFVYLKIYPNNKIKSRNKQIIHSSATIGSVINISKNVFFLSNFLSLRI